MPADIVVGSISEYQSQELKRLKVWLYRQRIKTRVEKDRAERRQEKEKTEARRELEQPVLFEC